MALANFLDQGARLGLERIAFVKDGDTMTFGEAQKLSCKVAQALKQHGYVKGSKAAVLAANDPKAWMCVFGFWRAGVAWVPLNPRSPLEEHQYLLNGFDVDILFFQKAFAPLLTELQQTCPQIKRFVCLDGEMAGSETFSAFSEGASHEFLDTLPEPQDLAAIMPTGGTTGSPKGVMLSHRNLSMSVLNNIINTPYETGEAIVNLAAAPMTHSAGFLSIPATARGGKIVVMTKPDPNYLFDVVCGEGVTEFFLPRNLIRWNDSITLAQFRWEKY